MEQNKSIDFENLPLPDENICKNAFFKQTSSEDVIPENYNYFKFYLAASSVAFAGKILETYYPLENIWQNIFASLILPEDATQGFDYHNTRLKAAVYYLKYLNLKPSGKESISRIDIEFTKTDLEKSLELCKNFIERAYIYKQKLRKTFFRKSLKLCNKNIAFWEEMYPMMKLVSENWID